MGLGLSCGLRSTGSFVGMPVSCSVSTRQCSESRLLSPGLIMIQWSGRPSTPSLCTESARSSASASVF
eukprot:6752934-Alexandrium_andersonii.AAC.1